MLYNTLIKSREFLTKNIAGLLAIIYPSNCLVCDRELTEQTSSICFHCYLDFEYTYYEKQANNNPIHEIFKGRVEIENAMSLLFFKQGKATQKLLHRIKYADGKELAKAMGEIIGNKMMEENSLLEIEALIPIPLHSKKEFIRGYNQSLKLSQGIAATTSIPVIQALKRTKHHASQTKKDRFERWENVASKFAIKEHGQPLPSHVAIVDDVLTTGATMEAACRVLLEQQPGIKISIITLAIAD